MKFWSNFVQAISYATGLEQSKDRKRYSGVVLTCPVCGSQDVRKSQRSSRFDLIRRWRGLRRYRCRDCRKTFYNALSPAERTEHSKAAEDRRAARRKKKRVRTELLLFFGMLLFFFLILRFLTRFH